MRAVFVDEHIVRWHHPALRLGAPRQGLVIGQAVADHRADAGADLERLGRVAGGLFLDHPFHHGAGEGHAAGLDRLQIGRGQQAQVIGAGGFGGGIEQVRHRSEIGAFRLLRDPGGRRAFQQVTKGRKALCRDVEDPSVADRHYTGADTRPPYTASKCALGGEFRISHGGSFLRCHYRSSLPVVRRVVTKARSRSGISASPRPGPGGMVMWPSATGGSAVTTSPYHVR